MFQLIKDLVKLDDSGPKAWKLLRDVIQPNTLPMVIVLGKEQAALSMRSGDDVKPVLDKIKDTYARMAAAGSNVSQMQQCTKIISVLDNSWDNLIPTLNTQQDQWTPEWLRQQILQEDFRRRHTGGGAANKTTGGSRGRGGGRGLGSGRGFGRGRGRATRAAAATAKATAGGEETAPSDGALDAVKKVQQPQQPHGEVLASVDATAACTKASSRSGEAYRETWHERLCHVNFPMLQKLVKDGSLKGLEVKGAVKEIGSCPTCLETNFTKFPFSSGTGPAKAPLALVHMWESGHKVKVIRTDNGGEFIGADFEAVLNKKGIQHQLTVPYNPQQNGVAERFNRTLQEGARTLLGRAGLLDLFWVTALRQIALVKNRVLATVGDKQAVRQRLQRGAADLSKGEMLLICYTDASFNSIKVDGTSIGGYVSLFGGGVVSWRRKKQNEVGLSSCETNYMALHHGVKEVVWLRRLLEEIGVCQREPTMMFCDNESAMKLAKNAGLHGLTKHIRPKWHWLRRLLDKEVRLEIVKTYQQAADILTKRLAEPEHWNGMKLAGMSVH
ncbi:unnamed protein product [Closterium sp. NIES-54]